MKNNDIAEIFKRSQKAEILEAFTALLDKAERMVIMVENEEDQDFYTFGFTRVYEVAGFVRYMYDLIPELEEISED